MIKQNTSHLVIWSHLNSSHTCYSKAGISFLYFITMHTVSCPYISEKTFNWLKSFLLPHLCDIYKSSSTFFPDSFYLNLFDFWWLWFLLHVSLQAHWQFYLALLRLLSRLVFLFLSAFLSYFNLFFAISISCYRFGNPHAFAYNDT